MIVRLLFFGFSLFSCCTSTFINEVRIEQVNPFPLELGGVIEWKISPQSGNNYDENAGLTLTFNGNAIASWKSNCKIIILKNPHWKFKCIKNNELERSIFFTPLREHYGQQIGIIFFPDNNAAVSQNGQLLLNTTIKITKQPTFLNMTLTVEREPDSVKLAPPNLNLSPPIFLDGTLAKLECTTDGSLPSMAISLDVVCNNPPRAAVEKERQAKAQAAFPYEIHYSYYKFRSPPSDEELAERMATNYARLILAESRIAVTQDNLTLSASLPISAIAHDCTVLCRLMGKEQRVRLTVYYQTTLVYLLPPPTDGLMRVGSSVECHADGFPPPSISLSLRQPMHQYQKGPIIDPKEYFVTASPTPPLEQLLDGSAVASTTRIGLRPEEYSIRGSKFTLAYNATPGVELILVCAAGNALPDALDFLGSNNTISTLRFTVSDVPLNSIGIVVGICVVILVIVIIVILLMICIRRRQKYLSNAIQTRSSAAPNKNGAKVDSFRDARRVTMPVAGSRGYASGAKGNSDAYEMPVRGPSGDRDDSPRQGLLMKGAGGGGMRTPPPDHDSIVQYAELTFAKPSSSATDGLASFSSQLDRRSLASGLTDSTSRRRHLPHSLASLSSSRRRQPHEEEDVDDGEGKYTEIVGTVQPKAYTSQLVFKQQKEATNALLAMNSSEPSVLV